MKKGIGYNYTYKFPVEDYRFSDNPEETLGPKWAKKILEAVLVQVSNSINPNGMSAFEAEYYYRFTKALDQANDEVSSVVLDNETFLTIANWLLNENVKIPPHQVTAFILLREAIRTATQIYAEES